MSEDQTAFDSVLTACQNQHRRIVLGALAEENRSLTIDDLTEAILNYNHQMPPIEASQDVITEIRLSLYHVHLPKLAAEGFIDYDRDHELVEATEKFGQLQPTLSTILDADPSLTVPMQVSY